MNNVNVTVSSYNDVKFVLYNSFPQALQWSLQRVHSYVCVRVEMYIHMCMYVWNTCDLSQWYYFL